MSTVTLYDYIINLLSVTLPAVTIVPVLYGNKFIRTLGRKYMILDSLRSANPNFDNFYNIGSNNNYPRSSKSSPPLLEFYYLFLQYLRCGLGLISLNP